ncbi:hypothetical protein [Nocardioides sp. TF02-7]|uniref:hypothetical protein n=1 Tax=Nocardioides sp. TF02-7 TaxID=2917724 RepID=UPI001F06FED9|nr:hypothetical protein [Nocardioides sp. TF02-7]UMG91822.1 hypothetical protein MF408_17480 [Nocardioides sp. TF02-7]
MSQRWIAFAVAAPLTVVLLVMVTLVPLPFAVYSPGPTYDVLATDVNEAEIIQVDGHRTYRDDGQIRFTTVQSSPRGDQLSLFRALGAWGDPDRAVVPYDVAHPEDRTEEEDELEGAVSMIGSPGQRGEGRARGARLRGAAGAAGRRLHRRGRAGVREAAGARQAARRRRPASRHRPAGAGRRGRAARPGRPGRAAGAA